MEQNYHGLEQYSSTNAEMIDGIFQAAEERGIYIQWVINHHGQYSINTNPVWNDNPYNAKNGGFLEAPEDFSHQRRSQTSLPQPAALFGCPLGIQRASIGVGILE